jgi:hypothetical protein
MAQNLNCAGRISCTETAAVISIHAAIAFGLSARFRSLTIIERVGETEKNI